MGSTSSSRKRIAVVGAGALGCSILPRLARMPIGELVVIDGDRVEHHNLERQPLFTAADIGRSKAGTACTWVRSAEPAIAVRAMDRFLDASNAHELLALADIVADCTDDLHAKALIDEVCGALRIPLVSGAVHEQEGQVIVLHAPGASTELSRNDLFNGRIGAEQDGCDMQRVPLAVIEAVGERMADLIGYLLTGSPVVNGRIELLHQGAWTSMEIAQ